ncbi:MAG: cupin domain-containing protein [Sedimentisphaerales bacterium]
MNNRQVKAIILISVFMCFAASIFIPGCTMDRSCSLVPPGEILVMDLNDTPEYQQLLEGKPQTCGMRSGRVYLQPGQSIGPHSTEVHEELLVFLCGKGTALIGPEQTAFEIGQGKVCYIPPYTIHNMKNTGTEPLVYIYCVAPIK